MKFALFTAIALGLLGNAATAQCVGGVCPLRQAAPPPPVVYQPSVQRRVAPLSTASHVYRTPCRSVVIGVRQYPTPVRVWCRRVFRR